MKWGYGTVYIIGNFFQDSYYADGNSIWMEIQFSYIPIAIFILYGNSMDICYSDAIDLSPYEWNFVLDMPGQKFHHSSKEHHKISNIPKFRCEIL
jgi:hypothetical protein